MRRIALAAAFAIASAPALAATPPSQMMANVYRLTEASATLEICLASAAYRSLPDDKAAKFQELSRRLAALIEGIGRHYRDDSLLAVYDATRTRIAANANLQLHVKNNYQYCGERLSTSLEAYVAENEALLNGFFRKEALREPAKRGALMAPPKTEPPQ